MDREELKNLTQAMVSSYEKHPGTVNIAQSNRLDRELIISILQEVRYVLFPGYFEEKLLSDSSISYHVGELLEDINYRLTKQVVKALQHTENGSRTEVDYVQLKARAWDIVGKFLRTFPYLRDILATDVQAAYEDDPAAFRTDETIFSYPGVYANTVSRIAHELYKLDVPMIPRIMTEYAHNLTGIDIHPGATIGSYFFIDHGTGIVIGETTVIGEHVKIYQGVTLGALSTRGGQRLAGVRRHPTIEDSVTIYANACVLGGETVIGEGSVIAGSAFVTQSVPPNSRVSLKNQEISVRISEKCADGEPKGVELA